jgi:hypothetical protein
MSPFKLAHRAPHAKSSGSVRGSFARQRRLRDLSANFLQASGCG